MSEINSITAVLLIYQGLLLGKRPGKGRNGLNWYKKDKRVLQCTKSSKMVEKGPQFIISKKKMFPKGSKRLCWSQKVQKSSKRS